MSETAAQVGDMYQPFQEEWGYAEGDGGEWLVVAPQKSVEAGEGTGVPIIARCQYRDVAEYIAFMQNTLKELTQRTPPLRGPQDLGEHTGGYL